MTGFLPGTLQSIKIPPAFIPSLSDVLGIREKGRRRSKETMNLQFNFYGHERLTLWPLDFGYKFV